MRLEDYTPSEPAEVSCISENGQSTLVFVREIRHSPEKVWSAMIDAEKIPKWAPYEPNRNLDSIGPVTLRMVDGSSPEFYESEVYEVVTQQKVKYSWGDSGVLSWELEPSETGTKLTLHHTVENPEWITPSAAGWHMCLDFAEFLLDGYALGPVVGEAAIKYGWQKLADHYAKVLGITTPVEVPDVFGDESESDKEEN